MATALKTKTQNALDEGRTLILGAQILLGVLYRAVFEPGFQKMPESSKYLLVISLGLIVLTVIILIAPASYHLIAEQGEDTPEFNRYVLRIMFTGLLPFALSLALAVYVSARIVVGTAAAGVAAALTAAIALFFWYGQRRSGRGETGSGIGEPN